MDDRIVAVFGLLVLTVLLGCRGDAPASRAAPAGAGRPARAVTGEPGAANAAAEPTESAPANAESPPPPGRIEPFPGLLVLPAEPAVEISAWVCIDGGWLEQIACSPRSREHESLVVTQAKPSQIHAALLMAGFEPGAPGLWSYENDEFSFIAPRGAALDLFVRYAGASGDVIEEPIGNWIRDHHGLTEFPDEPWIFGGSRIEPNPEWMGPGEHYVADATGSIIGLVTFGDEVIGFSRVLADQAAVQPPEWEVDTQRIPPIGTEVTLILRPAKQRP